MATSHTIHLDGPVHYLDYGGSGTPIILVHGLGASHTNWSAVGAELANHGHCVALDLIGFGLTPPWGRKADIWSQQKLLDRFIGHIGSPAVLVGNSMGGLIVELQASLSPASVAAMALVNPATPLPSVKHANLTAGARLFIPGIPGVGTALARYYYNNRTIDELLNETMEFVMAEPSRVRPADRELAMAMAERRQQMPWALESFAQATRSIASLMMRRSKFKRIIESISAPTVLIHGDRDGIVVPEAARWLATQRPDWEYHEFGDIGHAPQLECPEAFVEVLAGWIDRVKVPTPSS